MLMFSADRCHCCETGNSNSIVGNLNVLCGYKEKWNELETEVRNVR
jgi:hypothetical protein